MVMNKRRKNIYLNMIMTLALIFCIAVIMAVTYRQTRNLAERDCFQSLWDETSRMRDELREKVDSDTRLLETMSQILMQLPELDGVEAQKVLAFEETGRMIGSTELLLPDGRVIGRAAASTEAANTAAASTEAANGAAASTDVTNTAAVSTEAAGAAALDYEAEAALGAHLTGRLKDASGEWVVYNIVPVKEGSRTVALLCGQIRLEKLQEDYRDAFDNNGSRFHLLEAGSGRFLVDTIHGTLGQADRNRTPAERSVSPETVADNIAAGIPGELSFYSSTIQEYLYGVYMPVGIQDWIVLLGIPESIAFENVRKVQSFFLICVLMEALVLFFYFMLLLKQSRRLADEAEEQYHISQGLRQIQEILFHAVLRPQQIEAALKKLAEFLTAERVCLFAELRHSGIRVYHSVPPQDAILQKDFPSLIQYLKANEMVYFTDVDGISIAEPEKERIRQAQIQNGMGIVLRNFDNHYQGVLFAVNMKKDWKSAEPLDWTRLDFSMTLDNIEAFRRIEELGSRDQLTGLLNRNSYQKAMEFYERMGEDALKCIYIDADGLHELNNQLGHAEGDKMLKTISDVLLDLFGEETVYRIGGDEFLVFCSEVTEEELKQKLKTLQNSIVDAGYHISVGMAARKEAPLVYEMVRQAESRMYESKREYYRERKNGQKVREVNRQLEATLLEKRDLDAFCSVLSYRYVGVYIVNLSMDTTRAINIPVYFEERLVQTGGKYSEAIRLYAQDLIRPEDRSFILEMLDYEKLFQMLSKGNTPQFTYRKQDGNCIVVTIYPTPDFDEFQKECIWAFEIVE